VLHPGDTKVGGRSIPPSPDPVKDYVNNWNAYTYVQVTATERVRVAGA
jgi:hypothetical protein